MYWIDYATSALDELWSAVLQSPVAKSGQGDCRDVGNLSFGRVLGWETWCLCLPAFVGVACHRLQTEPPTMWESRGRMWADVGNLSYECLPGLSCRQRQSFFFRSTALFFMNSIGVMFNTRSMAFFAVGPHFLQSPRWYAINSV